MSKLRTGRIWKITNADNTNEWMYYGSFNLQDRDVIRSWREKYKNKWTTVSKEVIQTVQLPTLNELRLNAETLEKRARSGDDVSNEEIIRIDIPEEVIESIKVFILDSGDMIKEATAKIYIYHIKKIILALDNGKYDKKTFFDDERIDNYIIEQHPNYQSSIIGALMVMKDVILKLDKVKYAKFSREARGRQKFEAQQRQIKREREAKEEDKSTEEFNKLIEKRDKLTKGSMEHLLASIYTMIPSKRISTISYLSWDKKKRDSNYVDLDNGTLMIRNVKNIKYSGVKTENIPKELLEIMRDYKERLEEIGHSERGWFFVAPKTKAGLEPRISAVQLNKMLVDIFGKANDDMRKLHATYYLNKGWDINKVARLMDTSPDAIIFYYDQNGRRGDVKEIKDE